MGGLPKNLAKIQEAEARDDLETILRLVKKAGTGRDQKQTCGAAMESLLRMGPAVLPTLEVGIDEAPYWLSDFCAETIVGFAFLGNEDALTFLCADSLQGGWQHRAMCVKALGGIIQLGGRRAPIVLEAVEPALWKALAVALPGGENPSKIVARDAKVQLDLMYGKGYTKKLLKDGGEAAVRARLSD